MPGDAPILTPIFSTLIPELIGDGGGLPFTPDAPLAPFTPLDPSEPPVQALLAQIELGRKQASKGRPFRRAPAPPPLDDQQKLAGWRALAAADNEILYAKGRPPQMLTVAVKRERGDRWGVTGVSNSRPLRATRQGARASSWRLDPEFTHAPARTELHLLVTEQSQATGRLADDRMLAPDLFMDDQRVILRVYVKPLDGYTGRTRRHETAVTVRLPTPLGERALVDGALYEALS